MKSKTDFVDGVIFLRLVILFLVNGGTAIFWRFRGWWCCMFPGPSPWPIGHQFVGWGVIKKKIEIPTTLLAQQALTLSTTFREIMTRELQLWKSIFLKEWKKIQSKILLFLMNCCWNYFRQNIQQWNPTFQILTKIKDFNNEFENSCRFEIQWMFCVGNN